MTNRELSIAFQTDKRARDYIALAKLVDQYDFDAVTVYCDAPYHPSYGPLLLMAPHIERARLGPAGVSPSRTHPIDIAAQTALLADLATGGVYIGLVRGGWLAEHGIRELDPPIAAIREAIDIIRGAAVGRLGRLRRARLPDRRAGARALSPAIWRNPAPNRHLGQAAGGIGGAKSRLKSKSAAPPIQT